MVLYHFTQPANLFHIALNGLEPRSGGDNAFMSGGVPVVWLTEQQSNIATAADVAHVRKYAPDHEFAEGDCFFGGTARLSVKMKRRDEKLFRYLDFWRGISGDAHAMRKTARGSELWWVYLSLIPARRIDASVPAPIAIECLDHHIATHPDIEARAKFKMEREQIAGMSADTMVNFGIAA